jgi:hypothetical protein
MDHKYIQSMLTANQCGICRRQEIDHTSEAVCECCSNKAIVNEDNPHNNGLEIFTIPGSSIKMLMCAVCIDKEIQGQQEIKNNAESRVRESNLSMQARLEEVKHSIIERSDIFNAKLPSLIEICKSVDTDETVENKTFRKAELISDLFHHLTGVITEANKVKDNAIGLQRATQAELNILASQLKIEEREKLKLQDINYKPTAPKLVKTRVPKFDKTELYKYASEMGIPPSTLQTMASKRKCSVKEAAEILKGMLNL